MRDKDLIRLLLLEVEGEEKVDLSAYSEEQITKHKKMLIDDKLAEGVFTHFSTGGRGLGMAVELWELTTKGHDFLDSTRKTAVWQGNNIDLGKLGRFIKLNFNEDELRELYLALKMDYDGLAHGGTYIHTTVLVEQCLKDEKLDRLLEAIQDRRENFSLDDMKDSEGE